MTDYTIAGIVGIVLIVLITAVSLSGMIQQPDLTSASGSESLVGQATAQSSATADECQAKTYCAGTKLTMIQDDCSVRYAYCQYGCSDAQCL